MNLKRVPIFITMLSLFLFSTSCDNKSSKESKTTNLIAKKEELNKQLNKMKSELDYRIEELTGKSEKIGEKASSQVSTAINKLKAEREKVTGLLEEVKSSSNDSIEILEDKIENSYLDLKKQLKVFSKESKEWFSAQKEKI